MYSTCLFCSSALGRNESIEHFAVGRRLAFDAAKGRLWVICPTCARWNLTPLESRWEAIEEKEYTVQGGLAALQLAAAVVSMTDYRNVIAIGVLSLSNLSTHGQ